MKVMGSKDALAFTNARDLSSDISVKYVQKIIHCFNWLFLNDFALPQKQLHAVPFIRNTL